MLLLILNTISIFAVLHSSRTAGSRTALLLLLAWLLWAFAGC
jgi:hypothetical protein